MIRRIHFSWAIGLALSLLLIAQAVVADSIRIMGVGDSDTGGYGGFVSYRYDLYFMLIDAGYDVDFVGRRTLAHHAVATELYPRYDDFDRNHEGRYSALLGQVASSAATMMEVNQPDVVLIMGSHDICESGAGAPGIAHTRLGQIIDNMRTVNADVQFLLAQVYPYQIPDCHPDALQIIPNFNQRVADVASAKHTSRSRVVLVDHYTGFDINTMFSHEALHANRQGEMFMANNWFNALENLLPLIETENFAINPGLNDAWYNPATAGQGFFITVFPDIQMMFLAWFTYDTERPAGNVQANLGEPGHRWLTAFGPYVGGVADLEIEITSGGVFNAANPAPGSVADGTIMVEFNGCNAGTVTYDILSANVAGAIPIQRIALDNVPACEALTR
jgi:hypothetical protein